MVAKAKKKPTSSAAPSLLDLAAKASKRRKPALELLDAAREKESTDHATFEQRLKAEGDAIISAFSELVGKPMSPYYWNGANGGWTVYQRGWGDVFTPGTHLNSHRDGSYTQTVTLLNELKVKIMPVGAGFTYLIDRRVYTFDEVKKYLDLPHGKVWTDSYAPKADETHYSRDAVIASLTQFLVEIVDLDRLAAMHTQETKTGILATHLGCKPTDLKVESTGEVSALFSHGDEQYWVLNKRDAKKFYAWLVGHQFVKYFDAEVFAKSAQLSRDEVNALRFGLKDNGTFARVLLKLVDVKSYGESMSEKRSIADFLAPFQDHFVVKK